MMEARQLDVMRHALGVQSVNGKWTAPYRNHYVAGADDVDIWDGLVASGHAVLSRKPSELSGGMPVYSVTDHGKTAALDGLKFGARCR